MDKQYRKLSGWEVCDVCYTVCTEIWKSQNGNLCKKCKESKKTELAGDKTISSEIKEPTTSDILLAVNRLSAQIDQGITYLKTSLEKCGELNNKLEKIESHLQSQAKHFEELSEENKGLRSRVGELELRLKRVDEGLLCRSVEISGIPAQAASVGDAHGIKIKWAV